MEATSQIKNDLRAKAPWQRLARSEYASEVSATLSAPPHRALHSNGKSDMREIPDQESSLTLVIALDKHGHGVLEGRPRREAVRKMIGKPNKSHVVQLLVVDTGERIDV